MAFARFISNALSRQLLSKLDRSLALVLDRLQLHLIRKGLFAGQQVLPLLVAVYHDDGGRVVVQLPHHRGQGLQPRQLTGRLAAVAAEQLIAALRPGPGDGGRHHAVVQDAAGHLPQLVVHLHPEGVVSKGVQIAQRDVDDLLPLLVVPLLLGREERVVGLTQA